MADVTDSENADILTVEMTVTCSINSSDWIKLSYDSSHKVKLIFKAPEDLLNDSCTVDLIVNDNDPVSPITL